MTSIKEICAQYLNAFNTLSHPNKNDAKTNLIAVAKLISYLLVIPPITALIIKNITSIKKEERTRMNENVERVYRSVHEQPLQEEVKSTTSSAKPFGDPRPLVRKRTSSPTRVETADDRAYQAAMGENNDEKRAALLIPLAEKKHMDANFALGEYFKYFRKDDKKAASHFKEAALLAHPEAAYEYGVCYENGSGVDKDATQAFIWYAKAAQYGSKDGLLGLARCYEKGIGTPANKEHAAKYRDMANNPPPLGGYKL